MMEDDQLQVVVPTALGIHSLHCGTNARRQIECTCNQEKQRLEVIYYLAMRCPYMLYVSSVSSHKGNEVH